MEQLLKVTQAADQLGVERRTVYRLVATGRIRSLLVSRGARRIPASEIERYIAEQLETSPQPQAH